MFNKIIAVILVSFVIMGGSFISLAEDTTTSVVLTPEEMMLKEAEEQGRLCGTLDGEADGMALYLEGESNQYQYAMLGDNSIIKKYNLANDDLFYKLNFLNAYKNAYQIGFASAYRRLNMLTVNGPSEKAYEQGFELGKVEGGFYGVNDLFNGRYNDWKRSYQEFIAKGTVNSRYWLDRESSEYRLKFATGFQEGYLSGYIENYQTQNMRIETMNRNYKMITLREETIHFDDEYVNFVSGVIEKEIRTPVTMYIPAATITTPTYLNLFKLQNTNQQKADFKPVSSKYVVSVDNQEGRIELLKPIKLSFEYYGSEKAGIYKWENYQWVYQYSTLEDGLISTEIPAGMFNGGEYAIFIDEDYSNILDIRFNWAYKEIYTLMRRGIVEDSPYFEPDKKLSKLDLAKMLYRIMVPSQNYASSSMYSIGDISSTDPDYSAVKYAVDYGYLSLDSKGLFNPESEVSYSEFEGIAGRIVNRSVSWSEIASKMKNDKYRRSDGSRDLSLKMQRAEAVYAFYELIK